MVYKSLGLLRDIVEKYIYYEHYSSGVRRRYSIGPADGYVYVEKIHSLDLDNLNDVDFYEVRLNLLRFFIKKIVKRKASENCS